MMRVATTLLSPEEMGKVSLVLTTTAFFALFLVNPVGMFINRRLHAWQASGTARYYLTRYVSYLLFVALIAAVSLPAFHLMGLANFGVSIEWLIFLVCGSLLFNTINQTAIPSLNLLGWSGRFIIFSILTIIASFIFALVLVKIYGPIALSWLLGLLLGQTLMAVIGVKSLFDILKKSENMIKYPEINRKNLNALFGFAWPVSIAAGLGWVQGQGYRYIIEGNLGLSQLGLFVAGYGIGAGVISGFESVASSYLQPKLYRDASNSKSSNWVDGWKNYTKVIVPALVLTTALIMILEKELTNILLGDSFKAAADFVIWGALTETVRMIVSTYSLLAHVQMRTNLLVKPALIGSIVSIISCVLLLPVMGVRGVGISLVSSGLVVLVLIKIIMGNATRIGLSKYLLLSTLIYSSGLWFLAEFLRKLIDFHERMNSIVVVVFVGISYMGMQYFLFIKNNSNALNGK